MTDAISGLLSQKPESPDPKAGEVRRLSLERKPKKNKPDETWLKLKNEGEGYGAEYKILKAEKTEFTDNYGNESWSLLVEAVNGASDASGGPVTNTRSPQGVSPQNDDKDAQIARAVAFKGAVELVGAQNFPENKPVIEEVARLTEALLPIVRGDSGNDVPLDTAESVNADVKPDEDIPF